MASPRPPPGPSERLSQPEDLAPVDVTPAAASAPGIPVDLFPAAAEMAAGEGPREPGAIPALRVGDRIQVLWTIERDYEEEMPGDERRWWGARVLQRHGSSSKYTVLYDEYSEFPPAEVDVTLVSDDRLGDSSVGGEEMSWRRELTYPDGTPIEEVGVELDEDVTQTKVYSMRDVVRAQAEIDAEEGVSAGEVMNAALGSLPVLQQNAMALKYREFADELKAQLALLMAQRGAQHVVTQEDVTNIMEKIKSGSNACGRGKLSSAM